MGQGPPDPRGGFAVATAIVAAVAPLLRNRRAQAALALLLALAAGLLLGPGEAAARFRTFGH